MSHLSRDREVVFVLLCGHRKTMFSEHFARSSCSIMVFCGMLLRAAETEMKDGGKE